MVDTPEPKRRPAGVIIHYDEPATKPPPLLEIGVLAWIRKNLFRSPLDAFLTILGVLIVVGVMMGTVQWAVGQANWHSIILNLDRFIVGRLADEYVWRMSAVVLFVAFVAGISVAAYTRYLSPVIPVLLAIVVLPVLVVPVMVRALMPPPPAYLAAGSVEIVSGTAKEQPIPQLAFLARAGETITFSFSAFAASDETLAGMQGIVDRATNTLRNAAANRLRSMARYVELTVILARDAARLAATQGEYGELTTPGRQALTREYEQLAAVVPEANAARVEEIRTSLANPALSDEQIRTLTDELRTLVVPPTVLETYQLNRLPVTLRILKADGSLLGEQSLEPDGQPVQFTLPDDGWYVVEKTIAGDAPAAAMLAVQGIAPVFERRAGYLRLSDMFQFPGDVPALNGEAVSAVVLNENRYRGDRSFDAYLYLYVVSFFEAVRLPLTAAVICLVVGFFLGRYLDGRFSPALTPRKMSRRVSTWLLLATPIIVFILINGLDTLAYSAAAAWVVSIYVAFQSGLRVYLNAPPMTTRLLMALVVLVVGTIILVFLPALIYGQPVMEPLFAIALALPVAAAFFAGTWIGTGQSSAFLQRRIRWSGGLMVIFLAFPIIVGRIFPETTRSAIAGLLPYTDPATWGGLLLALFITIYGTLLAFPLGILLALGRRSSLPAIKYPCTIIIEMVRGTPFIVVLFAVQLLIPLVNEQFASIPNSYRALGATVVFVAAYLAENVRGGLQSIPHGQYEAGKAVGLPEWQITLYITLPQALRAVIPALVGQFISLFKDTSLLDIVGLVDLSRTVSVMVAQTEFNDARREGLVFITLIYFGVSYVIAYISRRIEESGSGAARRI